MDYYALIYVKPNVLTDEMILIGLIGSINNQPKYYFSKNRIRIAGLSLSLAQHKSLKQSVSTIGLEIDELNRMPNALPLFDHPFSLKIIEKTSFYKKNLLVYGNPSLISANESFNLEKLVRKLFKEKMDVFEPNKPKEPGFRSKWLEHQREVEHGLKRKLTLTPEVISTIYSGHQVDLIGCFDERIITFHSIDFNSSPRTIGKNLFEFTRLIRGLELLGKEKGLKKGVHYLVYEHPTKKISKEIFYKAEEDQSKGFKFIRLKDFAREVKSLRLKGENQIETLM